MDVSTEITLPAEQRSLHHSSGFSLATLMVVVTIVAVLCGIASLSPTIGIVLGLLAPPAAVRTYLATRYSLFDALHPPAINKIALFVGSVFLVAFIGILAALCGVSAGLLSGGLMATIYAAGTILSSDFPQASIVIGVIAGLFVACWVSYAMLLFSTPVGPPPNHHTRGEKVLLAISVTAPLIAGFVIALVS